MAQNGTAESGEKSWRASCNAAQTTHFMLSPEICSPEHSCLQERVSKQNSYLKELNHSLQARVLALDRLCSSDESQHRQEAEVALQALQSRSRWHEDALKAQNSRVCELKRQLSAKCCQVRRTTAEKEAALRSLAEIKGKMDKLVKTNKSSAAAQEEALSQFEKSASKAATEHDEERCRLQTELQTKSVQVCDLRVSISQLLDKEQQSVRDSQLAQQQRETLENELEMAKQALEQTKTQLLAADSRIHTLEQLNREMSEVSAASQAKIADLHGQIDVLHADSQELAQKCTRLADQAEKKGQRVLILQSQLQQLRESSESESTALRASLGQIMAENDAARAAAERSAAELQSVRVFAEQQIQAQDFAHAEYVKTLLAQLSQSMRTQAQLRASYSDAAAALEAFKAHFALEFQSSCCYEGSKCRETVQETLQSAAEAHRLLQAERLARKADCESTSALIATLNARAERQKSQLDAVFGENARLRQKVLQFEQKAHEAESSAVAELRKSINAEKVSKAQQAGQNVALQRENSAMREKATVLQKEVAALRQRIAQLEEQVIKQTASISKSQHSERELEQRQKQLEAELSDARRRADELKRAEAAKAPVQLEKAKQSESSATQGRNTEIVIDRLNKQLQTQIVQYREKDAQHKDVQQRFQQLSRDYNDLFEKYTAAVEAQKQRALLVQQEFDALLAENTTLQAQMQSRSAGAQPSAKPSQEISQLKEEIAQLQEIIAEKDEKILKMNQTNSQMVKNLSFNTQSLQKARHAASKLNQMQSSGDASSPGQSQDALVDSAEEQLEAAKAKQQLAEAQIRQLEEQVKHLINELDDVRQVKELELNRLELVKNLDQSPRSSVLGSMSLAEARSSYESPLQAFEELKAKLAEVGAESNAQQRQLEVVFNAMAALLADSKSSQAFAPDFEALLQRYEPTKDA